MPCTRKKKVNYTDYHLSFSYFLHWSCSISMTEDLQYRVYEKLLSQTGKDHEESWLYHLQEYLNEGYTIKQVKDQRIIVRRPWFLFSWILKRCHSAFINRWNTATLKTCTWGPCTLRENITLALCKPDFGKKNWLFCSLKPCCCNNYSCTCTLWEGKLTFLLIS